MLCTLWFENTHAILSPSGKNQRQIILVWRINRRQLDRSNKLVECKFEFWLKNGNVVRPGVVIKIWMLNDSIYCVQHAIAIKASAMSTYRNSHPEKAENWTAHTICRTQHGSIVQNRTTAFMGNCIWKLTKNWYHKRKLATSGLLASNDAISIEG